MGRYRYRLEMKKRQRYKLYEWRRAKWAEKEPPRWRFLAWRRWWNERPIWKEE